AARLSAACGDASRVRQLVTDVVNASRASSQMGQSGARGSGVNLVIVADALGSANDDTRRAGAELLVLAASLEKPPYDAADARQLIDDLMEHQQRAAAQALAARIAAADRILGGEVHLRADNIDAAEKLLESATPAQQTDMCDRLVTLDSPALSRARLF